MILNLILKLDGAVRSVCPIHGVSIGVEGDKQTWRIDFKDEATSEQRSAAQAVLDAFDPNSIAAEEVGQENAQEAAKRERATALEEVERQVKAGASQADINRLLIDLLKR